VSIRLSPVGRKPEIFYGTDHPWTSVKSVVTTALFRFIRGWRPAELPSGHGFLIDEIQAQKAARKFAPQVGLKSGKDQRQLPSINT